MAHFLRKSTHVAQASVLSIILVLHTKGATMADAPFHTKNNFLRAVSNLIAKADSQNRGDDLDRLIEHVLDGPKEVSGLARFIYLMDDDFRGLLEGEIDGYRRWLKKKNLNSDDQEILKVLLEAYNQQRAN